jgi:hypothetical protein
MEDRNKIMSDKDLDRLLNAVNHPVRPLGAEQRLMGRIATESARAATNARKTGAWPWMSALPLAASLVLGLYLGQSGYQPSWLDLQDTASLGDGSDLPTGFEELEEISMDAST